MADLNVSVITGRFGRDPDLKYTQSGKAVTNFSLAVNGYKEDDVSWIDCGAWEKTAEIICQYCKKGSQVTVQGRLVQQKWNDSDGNSRSKLYILVNHVQFMGKKEENGGGKKSGDANNTAGPNYSDDDIPF